MNNGNQSHEDAKWKALLTHSAKTFAGDDAAPFGFVTSTLARIKAENKERDLLEFIGLRAVFAALAVLVAVGGLTIGIELQHHVDLDPSLKGIVQAEDIPIA